MLLDIGSGSLENGIILNSERTTLTLAHDHLHYTQRMIQAFFDIPLQGSFRYNVANEDSAYRPHTRATTGRDFFVFRGDLNSGYDGSTTISIQV